jgi:hypothetical protein
MGKRHFVLSALSLGYAMLIGAPSWAATIEPGQGDLSINQGQGFKSVNSPAAANVGDSVMVGPGGSATVVYDDGCRVLVQPGAVATIAPLSPCASGSYAADMGVPPPVAPQPVAEGNDALWGWVIGGAFAAALGVGAWEATQDNGNSQPASP